MTVPTERAPDDRFRVPGWLDVLGYMVEHWPETWRRLGDAETRRIRDRLAGSAIRQPVYVTGLARAGSTVLLELLSQHPDVATHRYRDFPMLHVPWTWNRFVDAAVTEDSEPRERAHGDGIAVTPESPEAFEEIIWMSFFPDIHEPGVPNVLERIVEHPEFEAFYRDHIRKLLLLRGGTRYLAKGNYNVTRLGYLCRMFPDARIVLPIRDPVAHVASLMRQHDLFRRVGRRNPRARRHMRRAGHFEFGLDLRPINTGDSGATQRIRRLWASGADVEAWARYWAMVYGYVADLLERDTAVRDGTLLVRFEDLCRAPADTMRRIQGHAALPGERLPALAEERIREPSYYRPPFGEPAIRLIREHTGPVAARFGY
ncbi:MAG: sulfotransferase [Thalassobaculum sp.]|uniref:sulfotransferase n=1 Tax=Thalassobaculum sp. TaxID=2022740 RepID=UPI0032EF44C7